MNLKKCPIDHTRVEATIFFTIFEAINISILTCIFVYRTSGRVIRTTDPSDQCLERNITFLFHAWATKTRNWKLCYVQENGNLLQSKKVKVVVYRRLIIRPCHCDYL